MRDYDKIVKHIIDKMFEIAGHDVKFEDIKDKEGWFNEWTMTEEQNKEWRKYVINYFIKKLKMPKKQAEMEARLCDLNWGLRICESKK